MSAKNIFNKLFCAVLLVGLSFGAYVAMAAEPDCPDCPPELDGSLFPGGSCENCKKDAEPTDLDGSLFPGGSCDRCANRKVSNEQVRIVEEPAKRVCEDCPVPEFKTVNYGFNEATNKVDFTGWSSTTHDIVADIIALRKASKNKIVRMIMSSTVMGYILANTKINEIASKAGVYVTEDWAKSYIAGQVGVEIIVDDRTYKLSHKDTTEYRFFPENTVVSLTTRNAVGKTLMTSTPIEDGNTVDGKYGFVAVSQWRTEDPVTSWTKAEGVGLPVIAGINNTLYLSTIS
jgi:hypothetical protein